MQQSVEYITFGEIQKIKKQWYEKNGTGIGFQAAVQLLTDSGAVHSDIPKKPDFLSWDLESMDQFRRLTDQIPIPLEEIRSVKQEILDQITFLEIFNKVQISLESVYTENVLYSASYFTILYVLSGSCKLRLSDRTIEMQKGELCILPPDTPFCVFTVPGDAVINISSDKTHFEKQFHALLFQDNPLSIFFRHSLFENNTMCLFFMIPPTKDLKSIIQHMFHEFVTKDAYSHALFYDYLQILYANIIRSSQKTRDYYENRTGNSITMLMPAILESLENNYTTLTLEKLADQFHYDPAYLSREIKTHTGSNFAAIISNLKLQEGKRLLQETRLSIASVARQCGYHSTSHFCSAFKSQYGITASAFRSALNIKNSQNR